MQWCWNYISVLSVMGNIYVFPEILTGCTDSIPKNFHCIPSFPYLKYAHPVLSGILSNTFREYCPLFSIMFLHTHIYLCTNNGPEIICQGYLWLPNVPENTAAHPVFLGKLMHNQWTWEYLGIPSIPPKKCMCTYIVMLMHALCSWKYLLYACSLFIEMLLERHASPMFLRIPVHLKFSHKKCMHAQCSQEYSCMSSATGNTYAYSMSSECSWEYICILGVPENTYACPAFLMHSQCTEECLHMHLQWSCEYLCILSIPRNTCNMHTHFLRILMYGQFS